MSASAMETLPTRSALPGFTKVHGFNIPAPAPAAEDAPATKAAAANFSLPTFLAPISTARRAPSLQQPATPPATQVTQPPAAVRFLSPSQQPNVGWSGLLEISRLSGASGVLGCPPAVDEETGKDTKIEICCTAHTNHSVRRLIKSVIRGLKACQDPERAAEGMGGTYFFVNEDGRKVAIMKPCDEEPLAPNNPKGYVGRQLGEPGWKPTVRVGEAAMREVAAYLLDRDGFARVPTSVLVRARHPIFCYNNRMSSVRQSTLDLTALANATTGSSSQTGSAADGGKAGALPMKLGSLQEFVTHMCDTSEMGPSRFSVRDVHRIGILDIRLFNTDRHAGNMLVRVVRNPSTGASGAAKMPALIGEPQYELIPIDHGFCLPETLEACYFEWLHWPQAMLPFSEEELQYIRDIDIEADKELLRKELPNLRPECLRVMELSTTLLKRGAEAGLTLFDIASVMTRPFESGEEEPSELERTAATAKQALEQDESDEDGFSEGDGETDDDDVIIEGDSSEEDGTDSDAGDTPVGGAPRTMHTSSSNGILRQASSRVDEGMLFELEGDFLGAGAPATPPLTNGRSPGGASLGSSLSSAEDFSFGTTSLIESFGTPVPAGTAGKPAGGRMGVPSSGNTSSGSTSTGSVAMASSVCVTTGAFLWRGAHHQHRRSAVKRAATKHHGNRLKSTLGRGAHMYPPPVVAFAPESLNAVFTDMDEAQWRRFISLWECAVDQALRAGKWRQDIKTRGAPVAQSCPRF